MDLRVFFHRKFVVWQGRERSIAREFLKKIRKKEGLLREVCGKRKKHGSMEKSTCFVI